MAVIITNKVLLSKDFLSHLTFLKYVDVRRKERITAGDTMLAIVQKP
jgi:hypothetical protein